MEKTVTLQVATSTRSTFGCGDAVGIGAALRRAGAARRERRGGRGSAAPTPIALALVLLFATALSTTASAQKLVLLVRHAERADGGADAGSMTKPADPPLSTAGEARAARLATMLADAGIQAIFSTEYRRTQDTVRPLSQKIGVTVTTVRANDTAGLAQKLKSAHANDVVLIAGHSNTLPDIIKALGGPAITIGDGDYGDLFVLVPASGVLSRIRY
jgi:phosphohistidine phosphatase SixA